MEANIKCDFSTTTPCQVAEVEVHEVAKPSSRRAGRWWRGGGSGGVGVGIWLLGNSPSLLGSIIEEPLLQPQHQGIK